jgi:hypothetical protein
MALKNRDSEVLRTTAHRIVRFGTAFAREAHPNVISTGGMDMRTRLVPVLSMVMIMGLLVPTGASAKRVAAGGSVAIAGTSSALTNQLVAVVITANRGLEKTISHQLPLPGPIFVAPFFVNEDKGKPEQGDLVTTLILTNTTGAPLSVTLTLYDLDGSVLATSAQPSLAAHETRVIQLADLLP